MFWLCRIIGGESIDTDIFIVYWVVLQLLVATAYTETRSHTTHFAPVPLSFLLFILVRLLVLRHGLSTTDMGWLAPTFSLYFWYKILGCVLIPLAVCVAWNCALKLCWCNHIRIHMYVVYVFLCTFFLAPFVHFPAHVNCWSTNFLHFQTRSHGPMRISGTVQHNKIVTVQKW